MIENWNTYDNNTILINKIINRCAEKTTVSLLSAILYGLRAKIIKNAQVEYEVLLFVEDNSVLESYIKFNSMIKIELIREKLNNVKIMVYTPSVFNDILFNDDVVGTFLYIICKENFILYDKFGTFMAIKESISSNSKKGEEEFLKQCVEFAKILGSQKWEQKWEKTLIQYQYKKKRKQIE